MRATAASVGPWALAIPPMARELARVLIALLKTQLLTVLMQFRREVGEESLGTADLMDNVQDWDGLTTTQCGGRGVFVQQSQP